MKRWLLLLGLLAANAQAATIPYRQSLFKHGPNASAYGAAVMQRDEMLNMDLTSARLQGGWLLSHNPYFATTLGASYTGLLGLAKKTEHEEVEYRYYGPVIEFIALPESRLTPILSYGYEYGSIKRQLSSQDKDHDYSSLTLQELRFMLALSFGKYQQIVLGVAAQDIQHKHFFKSEADGDYYRRRGEQREKSRSYFAGLRLAAF